MKKEEIIEITDEEAREYMDSEIVGKFDLEDWEELFVVGVIDYPLHYVLWYKNDYFERGLSSAFYYKDVEEVSVNINFQRELRNNIKNIFENELIDFYCTVENIDGFKKRMIEKVEPQGLINKLYEKYTLEQFEDKIREYNTDKRFKEYEKEALDGQVERND